MTDSDGGQERQAVTGERGFASGVIDADELEDPEELALLEHVQPRSITPQQWERFEGHMAEIFAAFGMDVGTFATRETPRRFVRALYDSTAGYEGDPKLMKAFPTECRGGPDCSISQVIEGPISFYSLCEHHSLPFHGVAQVGYVAHDRIIGLSKLARIVKMYARRFTVQERLGQQVADTLVDLMRPHGVAVRLEAEHLCLQMRGVRDERSRTVTSFWRGAYEDNPELRSAFLANATRLG